MYDDKAAESEGRGAVRYLGVYLSFLGWEEQHLQMKKKIGVFFKKIAKVAPTLRQFRVLLRSLLTSQLLYVRTVMPASELQTLEFQEQCAKAVCGTLGLSHYGEAGKMAAHLFSPEEGILGMGVPNVDEIGMAQDIKALMTALVSKDETLAATLWTAVQLSLIHI